MPALCPLPVFHFTVQWNGERIGFCEVTGLAKENPVVESNLRSSVDACDASGSWCS
jgi:hypothetical protein